MYTRSSSDEILAYSRVIRLEHAGSQDGTLLGTFEHGSASGQPSGYVIRKSTDDGATWTTLATLTDPLPGAGHPSDHMWQPFLYEFPKQLGQYPAGTLALVGNSSPSTTESTDFIMWHSTDEGTTWTTSGSAIQHGGGGTDAPPHGSGIWEPFLTLDGQGRLAMFFSDERREPQYSQVVAHIVSNDGGDTWSANPDGSANFGPGEITDVASTTATDRPGMPTVATLPDGRMVLAFEMCGEGRNCEAHTKISSDGGTTFGTGATDLGAEAVTSDGRYLGSSPYLVWSPAGGPSGQLMLTGMRTRLASDNSFTQEDGQAIFTKDPNSTGPWSWTPAPLQTLAGSAQNCGTNYSPDLLLGLSGTSVRYTAASAVGGTGCEEATGEANSGVLPYASSFDGGKAGWIDYGGCWSTLSGVLSETCGGSGGNKSVAGSTGWSDYTLQGDVRIDTGAQAGFGVRVSDPNVGADSLNGYYVGVSGSALFLGKENGGWTSLQYASIPGGLATGSWYHVTVQAVGCTLTVSGSPSGSTGAPIGFSYTDTGCFATGGIAVRDQGATASWRDIVVTQGGLTSLSPAPYQAPFDSGSTSGWTTYGGTWTVGGDPGVYSDTAGGAGDKSIAGSASWTDYTATGEVSLADLNGNAGLLIRATSPAVGTDSLDGYFVGVSHNALFLGREGYGWTPLAYSALPVPLAADTWYRITADVTGCTIAVTGVPAAGGDSVSFSYDDSGCTTTAAGAIGVRAYNTPAEWRHIEVAQH